jgi:hypothetical protein
MFRRGAPQPGQRKLSPEAAVGLVSWLESDRHAQAVRLLMMGERLAQEAVGLSGHDDWMEDLRNSADTRPTR